MQHKYKLFSSLLTDTETGEIIDAKDVDNIHVALVEQGGYVRNPRQLEYLREREARYNDRTPYIWANFQYNTPYFPSVDDANISRMIFFSTFCNDSGYVMHCQDIKQMLKLNYNQVKNFRDNLINRNILAVKNNKAYISNSAFYRGTLKDIDKDFIRIFLDSNRQLYLSCTSTQHKHLSYIYKMIPYVNRQTNILSHNQQEQDITHIEYMTIKEFCNIVGYDSSHSTRLQDALSMFRIYGELAVGFFDNISELNPRGKYVVVNPKLFFGGERELQTYKDICKLFKAEKEMN